MSYSAHGWKNRCSECMFAWVSSGYFYSCGQMDPHVLFYYLERLICSTCSRVYVLLYIVSLCNFFKSMFPEAERYKWKPHAETEEKVFQTIWNHLWQIRRAEISLRTVKRIKDRHTHTLCMKELKQPCRMWWHHTAQLESAHLRQNLRWLFNIQLKWFLFITKDTAQSHLSQAVTKLIHHFSDLLFTFLAEAA